MIKAPKATKITHLSSSSNFHSRRRANRRVTGFAAATCSSSLSHKRHQLPLGINDRTYSTHFWIITNNRMFLSRSSSALGANNPPMRAWFLNCKRWHLDATQRSGNWDLVLGLKTESLKLWLVRVFLCGGYGVQREMAMEERVIFFSSEKLGTWRRLFR